MSYKTTHTVKEHKKAESGSPVKGCYFCGEHQPTVAYITRKAAPTCEQCLIRLTYVEWDENTPILTIKKRMVHSHPIDDLSPTDDLSVAISTSHKFLEKKD